MKRDAVFDAVLLYSVLEKPLTVSKFLFISFFAVSVALIFYDRSIITYILVAVTYSLNLLNQWLVLNLKAKWSAAL